MAITDQVTETQVLYHELVEWTASILTQYSIQDLWSMDAVLFFRTMERAELIQKERMKSLKKQRAKGRK